MIRGNATVLLTGFAVIAGCVAAYAAIQGDWVEARTVAGSTLFWSSLAFLSRSKARRDAAALSALHTEANRQGTRLGCALCGSTQRVELRAYHIVVSALILSFKSVSVFRPVCDACKVKAGMGCSALTFLLGWWAIPGAVWTMRALYKNFSGGSTAAEIEGDRAGSDG